MFDICSHAVNLLLSLLLNDSAEKTEPPKAEHGSNHAQNRKSNK
jgi:hypothetical protein